MKPIPIGFLLSPAIFFFAGANIDKQEGAVALGVGLVLVIGTIIIERLREYRGIIDGSF